MSRIGKLPIVLPEGVSVKVKDGVVSVEGPKGKLVQDYRPEVEIKVSKDNTVVVTRTEDTKAGRSFHGLYRQLVSNMVEGVSKGFSKKLLVNGVGYRVEVKGDILILNLGYSNPIEYLIPSDVQIVCETPSSILISGISKERVGHLSAEIRSLRPPEPYKGKGIKYEDEIIRRKVGKSGGAK
ncbi:MAG: 50S ribosomal protein L6 [Sphaerochaetaceae bacterium]|jgi:large subunit ribosomal protein L6|nr:50S ribosomal protein L6 [Sphaerochaetaceae bacterium]HHU89239.1 50S ribosomal protein L6 [Spirochaetales bacterium]